MGFWSCEVKVGESLKVVPGDQMVLHLSQASLCVPKHKKDKESVFLFVNVDGKELVLGTLISNKLPQQQFDLRLDKDFELSHSWKSGNVYFYGHRASSRYEEGVATGGESGAASKSKQEKPADVQMTNASNGEEFDAGKQKATIVEPKKDDKEGSSDRVFEDLMSEDTDDKDDSKADSGQINKETPKKDEPSKKRAAESATQTPVQDKKARVTPQTTDSKNVGDRVATPHPAKQAGRTPATGSPVQLVPRKAYPYLCKSCPRKFRSEEGLEDHTKVKHPFAS